MTKQRRKTTAKKSDGSVSRRTFLQSVIVASAATGAAALPASTAPAVGKAATSAAAPEAHATAFKVLTDEQGDLLTMVLNRLVPAEGTMPGAGDIGIAQFIDGAMMDAPHLRQPILDVLGEVHVAGLRGRDGAAVDEVLTRVQREQQASFEVLLQATYTGYYSDPRVLDAIGWVPPGVHADSSDSFDVAMLEDVRKRGPIFRAV